MSDSFRLIYSVNGLPLIDATSRFGLTNFSYSSDIYGTSELHSISFTDPSFDIVEKLYLFGGENIQYQFGYNSGVLSSNKSATVFKYIPEFDGSGVKVKIIGCDKRLNMHRGVKNRGFINTRRSDIVRQLALENGLIPIIEDTIGNEDFIQVWESDIHFLLQQILPGSLSAATGRGDYYLYIEDGNILHFHTPDYKKSIYRRFTIGRDGDIIKFTPVFSPDTSNALGGDQLYGIGYDPINKTRLKFISDNTTTLEKELTGKRTTINPKSQLAPYNRVYIGTSEDIFNLIAETKYRYYTALQIKYMAELLYKGDPAVKPGNIIEVIVPKNTGGMHYSSGKYLVHKVSHAVNSGEFYTKLVLSRNGSIEGDQELLGNINKVKLPIISESLSTVPVENNTIEKIAEII